MTEVPILVNMAILYSDDGGDTWTPMAKEDVPDWVQEPETIEKLSRGLGAQAPGETRWYVGYSLDKKPSSIIQSA